MTPVISNKHQSTRCHLCGEEFICKLTRGWLCRCTEIELTAEQSEKIQEQTGGTCVCNSCLLRLRDASH